MRGRIPSPVCTTVFGPDRWNRRADSFDVARYSVVMCCRYEEGQCKRTQDHFNGGLPCSLIRRDRDHFGNEGEVPLFKLHSANILDRTSANQIGRFPPRLSKARPSDRSLSSASRLEAIAMLSSVFARSASLSSLAREALTASNSF